jgi:hypothetical protein
VPGQVRWNGADTVTGLADASTAAPAPARATRWTRVTTVVVLALLPVLLWFSRDFGVTWDEGYRQVNGERIWRLYQGHAGPPSTANEHFYGGLFDVLAVGLQKVVPLDPYDVRHLLNAAFGWAGIVLCGVLAARVGGPPAGLLAVILLATWPTYIGHTMNNPKDLPFATTATAVLAVMAALPRRFPYLPLNRVLGLGVTVGLALAVRPGGLLLVGYVGLWVAASIVVERDRNRRQLAHTAAALAAILAIALIVPMPVWPYLWERPLIGAFEAAEGVSHYRWNGMVLFLGRDVRSVALPWTYVPVWLFWTTPPVVFAGAALSLRGVARAGWHRRATLGLWFAVLFPILYVIGRRSTLYDGIRHLLFITPPLVALAALGWHSLFGSHRQPTRVAAAVLLAIGLAEPIVFQLRNHPNQVVYFQPLVGGPAAAAGRFELDYWGNCLYQAEQRVARIAREAGVPVTVSGGRVRQLRLNAPRVRGVMVTPLSRRVHELEIVVLRGRRRDVRAFSVREDVLWRVTTADEATLCAVVPGPRYQSLRDALEKRGALHVLAE